MRWRVRFTRAARAQFAALDPPIRARVGRSISRLAADPRAAPNVKAMSGGGLRLRVGDWRVAYELQDDELIVFVIRVAHRREVYR